MAGAILVFAFFAVVAGDSGFLTSVGTIGYLEVSAQLGILVVPVALLMISGEFDLSVGSMVGAAGMIIAIPTSSSAGRCGRGSCSPSVSPWSSGF